MTAYFSRLMAARITRCAARSVLETIQFET